MKTSLLILGTALIFAVGWPQLPSFHWGAAITVGAIVTVAAAVVIGVAILTPVVAIWGGATILGTVVTIAAISVATGVIGGTAAGFYWGHLEDGEQREREERIKHVSNQLDIYFVPSPEDPERAADFKCVLVVYEETDLKSRSPTVTTRKTEIDADNSDEFYSLVKQQMSRWFGTIVLGDPSELKHKVVIYTQPHAGEGIYERLKEIIAEKNGSRPCVISLVKGRWTSALPQK